MASWKKTMESVQIMTMVFHGKPCFFPWFSMVRDHGFPWKAMVRNHGFPCLLNGIMEKNHGKCPNHDHGKTPSFAKFTYSTLPHSTLTHSTLPHSTIPHYFIPHIFKFHMHITSFHISQIPHYLTSNYLIPYYLIPHSPHQSIQSLHHITPHMNTLYILTFISFQLICSTCTWLWFIYNIYPFLGLLWCFPEIC